MRIQHKFAKSLIAVTIAVCAVSFIARVSATISTGIAAGNAVKLVGGLYLSHHKPVVEPGRKLSRILYIKENGAVAGDKGRGSTGDIWIVRANGSGNMRLTSSGKCLSPAWVPDGKSIIFVSNKQVYRMNSDGTGVKQLTHLSKGWGCDEAAVSPNGRKIVFRAEKFLNLDASTVAFYIMNPDGSGQRLIISPKSTEVDIRNPAFTNDSANIIYGNCGKLEVGAAGLHKYSLTRRRFTKIYGSDAELNLNKDVVYKNPKVYFSHMPSKFYELYEPNVSPNGKQIACMCWGYNYIKGNTKLQGNTRFDSNRIGIVVLNTDGTNAQMVYSILHHDFTWRPEGGPDWSPNGRQLIFPAPEGLTILDLTTKKSQVVVRGKNLSWPAWQ